MFVSPDNTKQMKQNCGDSAIPKDVARAQKKCNVCPESSAWGKVVGSLKSGTWMCSANSIWRVEYASMCAKLTMTIMNMHAKS